jgi:hypothetical protein
MRILSSLLKGLKGLKFKCEHRDVSSCCSQDFTLFSNALLKTSSSYKDVTSPMLLNDPLS